jgi:hypothetical protein
MKIDHVERRRSPRVPAASQVSLNTSKDAADAVLKNVSTSGLLCQTERPIAEMTIVEVKLALPPLAEEQDRRYLITGRGVVVRCEPAARGNSRKRYEVAIYFTQLTHDSKASLERFIAVRKT